MADDEARWALQLLETSIQASGLSDRQLERRLGWDKGTLGKILREGGAMGHQQMLDILEAPSRDGRAGSGGPKGSSGGPLVGTLLERFGRLGIPASDGSPAERPATPLPQGDALVRRVEELLAEAFGRLDEIPEEED